MAFFAPHIVEPNAKHTYTVILFCGRDSNSSNLEKSFSIPDPPPTRASQHALLHVDGRSTHPEIDSKGGGEGRIELLVGKSEKVILEGPSRSMTSTLWASVAIATFIRPYQGGDWVDLGVLGMCTWLSFASMADDEDF
ncbi:conserved hypothetical protein [Histoplasma capsulatum var. duboisii H88]|uniref:Uncharacterized protein n=1 Tax=Ajellomyces capsulatus (strain H88) TaxID=544711 RepID=F0UCI5_AJEC8|nr:conserved hypothetical protein [Histoplasma capsulatum var. duboisii H88]